MSLLGSIFSGVKSLAGPTLGAAIGSVIPGVGTTIGGMIGGALSGAGGSGGGGKIPSLPVSGSSSNRLPMITGLSTRGVGALAAGAAAVGGAVYEYNKAGHIVRKKRRRRKGITPKDLSSFKRVARLIDKFAAPVHHLRKSSFKPHK